MEYDLGQLFVDVLSSHFFLGGRVQLHVGHYYGCRTSKVPALNFQIHQIVNLRQKNFLAVLIAVSAKQSQCRFLLTKFILLLE